MKSQDKRILELFIAKVEELRSCRLVQTSHQISFTLNVKGKEGKTTTTLPDEESLRSFLLVFRNFYSPSETISFRRVCDILSGLIQDRHIKENINKTRDVYEDTLRRSPLSLIENDQAVSPEEVLRRWMYGYYHHTDNSKRKEIEAWGFAVGLTKMQFISTIFDLSRCVVWLENVARRYVAGEIN